MSSQLPSRQLVRIAEDAIAGGLGSFTLLQMNTLAHSLCTAESFPYVPAAALDWDRRKVLLLQEITRTSPDIACLEEIDAEMYDTWFRPQLATHGYTQSVFQKKANATSRDGVAVFVRDTTFQCMRTLCVPLGNTSQVVAVVQVRPRDPLFQDRRLYVAVTHFKAKHGNEGIRLGQAREVLQAIHSFVQDTQPGNDNPCIVLAGDLNDVPESAACTFLATQQQLPRLRPLYNERTAPYTTAKRRDKLVVRTIDHIFYTPQGLQATHVLSVPSLEQVFPQYLPALNYASDHLAIAGTFQWRR